MIILREQVSSQTFRIIPRELEATSMTFTHDETGVVLSYSIAPAISSYYLSISKIVALKENHFYSLKVYNGSDIVYRDKVFCTNQTVSTYSVNDTEYVQNSSNNDYVIYE